jgi:hypothetical protein
MKLSKLMDVVFSIGAAIVILGALGKITHASWGGIALSIGMYTEVVLFVAMGVVTLWSKSEEEVKSSPQVVVDFKTKELNDKLSLLQDNIDKVNLVYSKLATIEADVIINEAKSTGINMSTLNKKLTSVLKGFNN